MDRRQELVKEIEVILRLVNRKFFRELNQVFADKLSYSEFMYMKHLDQKGSEMVSALSEEFSVSVSHITAVMNTLVGKGYVNRVRSDQDRRVVELSITEAGKALLDEVESLKEKQVQQIFEPLSTAEMEQLLELYRKLIRHKP